MSKPRVHVWLLQPKDRPGYQLQWVDPVAHRRKTQSAGTTDAKEAETARKDLEYELNHGRYQAAALMQWERFREQFEEEYVSGCRRNTRENYGRTLDLFEEICNPKQVRSIDERVVSAYVAGMRKYAVRGRLGFNPSTIRSRLQLLHTTLAWAVEQKILERVPAFPGVKVPDKDPRPVPTESFEKLLEKAPDAPMRAYLLCGWLAGLRLSEAFHLEWEETEQAPWIDLGRNRIIFPAEFVKAVKDQWVPLDPQLRTVLESLPRHGKRVFRFLDPEDNPVLPDAISTRVRALARRAGVKMTMHTLRKGFGSRYAARVSAQVLQKLMRHANIKTTMKYYANIDKAVEEAVLGPSPNVLHNKVTQTAVDNDRGQGVIPIAESRTGDKSVS